jgi:chromosome segregation ATPase
MSENELAELQRKLEIANAHRDVAREERDQLRVAVDTQTTRLSERDRENESAERRIRELQRENERLRAVMEPGTMEARMQAVWDVAEKYGHPAHSCRDAITFLDKYATDLLQERDALRAEVLRLTNLLPEY